jgi:hypothetical protein
VAAAAVVVGAVAPPLQPHPLVPQRPVVPLVVVVVVVPLVTGGAAGGLQATSDPRTDGEWRSYPRLEGGLSRPLPPSRDKASTYFAYGLGIRSALPLPELVASKGATEVSVRFARIDSLPADTTEQGFVRATHKEVRFFWEDAGAFLVRGGREIVIDPKPGADERVLRVCVLGPVLGALLYQRGLLTLHASTVVVAGEAVAFIGEKGMGKSTMAAALCARGHRLVADDITVVWFDEGYSPMTYPGYPQLKLWPQAAAFLGDAPESLPKLEPSLDKRARLVTSAFSIAPIPLKRIYVLDEGEAVEIEPLSPQEALVELIQHSYGRRLLQTMRTSSHFVQCTSVVRSVPVFSLRRPYRLSTLPDLTRIVEKDLAQSGE